MWVRAGFADRWWFGSGHGGSRRGGACRWGISPFVGVEALEVDGAAIAERRMAPLAVVPALDVLEAGAARGGAGGPRVAVEELALEGGEEALGHGRAPATTSLAARDCGGAHQARDPLARTADAVRPI